MDLRSAPIITLSLASSNSFIATSRLPIRAASTERECLALAATRLAPAPQAFLTQLVAGWQTVAYARRQLTPDGLEALCAGFDAQLPVAAPGRPA